MADDPGLTFDLTSDIIETTSVTKNLSQEVHVTTRGNVELALRRVLPRYTLTEQMIAILSVVIALGGTLVTANFQELMGIPPVAWKTVYVLGTLSAFGWLVVEGRRWLTRPRMDDVVDAVMGTGVQGR